MKLVSLATVSVALVACAGASPAPAEVDLDARAATAAPSAMGSAAGPQDARAAALREATEYGMIGLIGRGDGERDGGPDEIGEAFGAGAFGAGGLGLSGAGFGQVGAVGGLGTGRARSEPPKLQMGKAELQGKLPPEVVQRIVRQNFGRFRLCYEAALQKKADLAGRVTVRFVIEKDGSVSSASDGGSDVADANLIACVTRAFSALSFPEPEGGGKVTVRYPLVFSPGEASAPAKKP